MMDEDSFFVFALGIALGMLVAWLIYMGVKDKPGKLGDVCYGNQTCDEGLTCYIDKEADINKCVKTKK